MDYAASLGIDTTEVDGDYGLRYNEHWGELNRYTVNFDENNNPIDTVFAENEVVNEKNELLPQTTIKFKPFVVCK